MEEKLLALYFELERQLNRSENTLKKGSEFLAKVGEASKSSFPASFSPKSVNDYIHSKTKISFLEKEAEKLNLDATTKKRYNEIMGVIKKRLGDKLEKAIKIRDEKRLKKIVEHYVDR